MNSPQQRGFSLVELMIGLTLGLIILTALVTLFVDMSRTNQEMSKVNSQIENARFAMQFLADDIVHAGYWGGFVPEFDDLTAAGDPTDAPDDVPAVCEAFDPGAPWSDAQKQDLIGIPIQVTNDPATLDCGTLLDDHKAGTDILVIRHADTCVAGSSATCPDTAGNLYFQVSFCESDALPYALATTGLDLNKRNCVTNSDKRKFVSSIYFIKEVNGVPTLMRSEFGATSHQPAQPLIEGIEDFRVEIGVDNVSKSGAVLDHDDFESEIVWTDPENRDRPENRGDGIPDEYKLCDDGCDVDDLMNAVTVRLYVLARTDRPTPGHKDTKAYVLGAADPIGPFNDGYKRHVYSSTVRLVNVSGRRETP